MDKPQNKKYKYDYFISYADGDSEWVERFLIPRLTKGLEKKVVTNKDTEKRYGKPKVLNLQDAVINSNQLILIITPEYQLKTQSEDYGYRKTIEVMKQSHDIVMESWRVIPLVYKETPLPLRLDFITPIDFTDEDQWEVQLQYLVGSSTTIDTSFFKKPDSPYLGLDSFTEKESQYFYGRSYVVDELKLRLTANHFITIFGSSGSGKSSVVQAGLIPSIKKSEKRESKKSCFFSMVPNEKPITAIIEFFGDEFLSNPESSLKKLLSKHNKQQLFIFVDQFEETFSIAKGENKEFFEALTFFIKSPKCSLVIASRSDFFEDLTKTPIWDSIESNIYRLLPLSKKELAEAISKPIRNVGGGISDLLVERMVNDAGTESGILPFVQVTMDLLWKDLEDGYLTLSDYEALSITDHNGQSIHGLKAAIALKANSAIHKLGKNNKKILRCLLLRLVQFGENGAPDTRLPQPFSKLKSCGKETEKIIEILSSKEFRLLNIYGDKQDKNVNIVHESIIYGWPLLQDWIGKYRDDDIKRRNFNFKLEEWIRLDKDKSALLGSKEIKEAKKWLGSYELINEDNKIISEYIDKSVIFYNPGWNPKGILILFLYITSSLFFISLIYTAIDFYQPPYFTRYAWGVIILALLSFFVLVRRKNESAFLQKISQTLVKKYTTYLLVLYIFFVSSVSVYFYKSYEQITRNCNHLMPQKISNNMTFSVFSNSIPKEELKVFSKISQRFTGKNAQFIVSSAYESKICSPFFTYNIFINKKITKSNIEYSLYTDDDLVSKKNIPINIIDNSDSCLWSTILSERLAIERKSKRKPTYIDIKTSCPYLKEREDALYLMADGNYLLSIDRLNKIKKDYGNKNDINYFLSKNYFYIGDYYKAKKYAESYSYDLDKNPHLYEYMGKLCMKNKKYKCAKKYFYSALNKEKNAINYINIASVYNKEMDFKKAKNNIDKAEYFIDKKIYDKWPVFMFLQSKNDLISAYSLEIEKSIYYKNIGDKKTSLKSLDYAYIFSEGMSSYEQSLVYYYKYKLYEKNLNYHSACKNIRNFVESSKTTNRKDRSKITEVSKGLIKYNCK